jgi:predicted ester cyclase
MSDNSIRLDAALAAWNAGDLDGYLELYDPEIRLHGYTPEPMSKDEVRGFYAGLWASFPNPQLTIEDTIEAGDTIVLRFVMTGRHDGDFNGVPPTGVNIVLPGITILRFGAAGTVVERWSQSDFLSVLVQVGAIPAPSG